jgi:hypothetical protein
MTITIFTASDVCRWGNLPHEWLHKLSQLSHLLAETATWNLRRVRDSRKSNVWCGIMQDRLIGLLFLAENTKRKYLPWYVTTLCLSTNWWHWKKNKKVLFCFHNIVPHNTSVMSYEMPWMSDFLIGGLEETDQRRVPHKVIPSQHCSFFFLNRFIKKEISFARENPRFTSSACCGSQSGNASTNMARHWVPLDVCRVTNGACFEVF